MPRQASGAYQQPANTAAVSGQLFSSSAFNSVVSDIGTELTNSLDRGGRSSMTANLPMGGNVITGHGAPSASTDVPNKAYVDSTVATFFSTGDIKPTFKTAADTGWILMDDGTFGSALSGASTRANADTQALFNLFFANMTDSWAPLLTSGGVATTRAAQTNAATAWAANCRMSLPKALGRALGVAGAGSGLTARALGSSFGQETQTLSTNNLPPYTPAGTITNGAISISHNAITGSTTTGGGGFPAGSNGGATITASQAASTFTGTAQGGTSAPFSILSPIVFVNWMVKI